MVSIAFVLVNIDLGKVSEVAEELREIPEVKELYHVYGIYDCIVKIEAKTMQHLKDTITTKIKPLRHVKSTLTMIVVE